MRKSISAPNLTDMSVAKPTSLSSLNKMRGSVNGVTCRAVPMNFDNIVSIVQVDSMINSPITQHIQCAVTHEFPTDLLGSNSDQIKDLATCVAEPADNDFEYKNRLNNVARSRTFLERCVDDNEVTERYALHVIRQRKMKHNK
jgi:hypothetical protein